MQMNRNFIIIIIMNCVYIQRFERLESPGRRLSLEKGEANRTVLKWEPMELQLNLISNFE